MAASHSNALRRQCLVGPLPAQSRRLASSCSPCRKSPASTHAPMQVQERGHPAAQLAQGHDGQFRLPVSEPHSQNLKAAAARALPPSLQQQQDLLYRARQPPGGLQGQASKSGGPYSRSVHCLAGLLSSTCTSLPAGSESVEVHVEASHQASGSCSHKPACGACTHAIPIRDSDRLAANSDLPPRLCRSGGLGRPFVKGSFPPEDWVQLLAQHPEAASAGFSSQMSAGSNASQLAHLLQVCSPGCTIIDAQAPQTSRLACGLPVAEYLPALCWEYPYWAATSGSWTGSRPQKLAWSSQGACVRVASWKFDGQWLFTTACCLPS